MARGFDLHPGRRAGRVGRAGGPDPVRCDEAAAARRGLALVLRGRGLRRRRRGTCPATPVPRSCRRPHRARPPRRRPVADAPSDVTSVDGVEVALEPVAELAEPIAMATRPGEPDRVYVAERAGRVAATCRWPTARPRSCSTSPTRRRPTPSGGCWAWPSPPTASTCTSATRTPTATPGSTSTPSPTTAASTSGSKRVGLRPRPAVREPQRRPGGLRPRRLALPRASATAAAPGDPLLAGQDRGQLLGSILRIDPRGGGRQRLRRPADNPYVGQEGARPEVWLKGVRNPWRFAFDRADRRPVDRRRRPGRDRGDRLAPRRGRRRRRAGRQPRLERDGGRPALRGRRRARGRHAAGLHLHATTRAAAR